MFLLEYEGKELFKKHGIKVPKGFTISKGDDITQKLKENNMELPVVLKGQYLMGGRGKAGAVKIARSEDELREKSEEIFNLEIKGAKPEYILVEEFVEHDIELYISILVSKASKSLTLLASRYGGVDVEEIAKSGGEILKLEIDPVGGLSNFHAITVSKFLLGKIDKNFITFVKNLYKLVVEEDLLLAEINPLTIKDGEPLALDSKIIVDDNSEFRHDLTGFYEYKRFLTWGEKQAREYGFAYVPLKGDIAVIGNGAGLVMATLDLVKYYGGEPACFLDVGGGASSERIAKALEVVYKEISPKKIFINIFAGITRCDEVAKGIVEAVSKVGIPREMFVIRLTGTLEDVGEEILRSEGFTVYKDMDEAAKKVVGGD